MLEDDVITPEQKTYQETVAISREELRELGLKKEENLSAEDDVITEPEQKTYQGDSRHIKGRA